MNAEAITNDLFDAERRAIAELGLDHDEDEAQNLALYIHSLATAERRATSARRPTPGHSTTGLNQATPHGDRNHNRQRIYKQKGCCMLEPTDETSASPAKNPRPPVTDETVTRSVDELNEEIEATALQSVHETELPEITLKAGARIRPQVLVGQPVSAVKRSSRR